VQPVDSRERILQATRARLNSGGILGLRVADVAKDADTSITLIYKYYRDRDGLLAQVLGDMYDEFRQRQMQRIDTWLSQNETITFEQYADLTPNPAEETKIDRDFRLQMLATALENEELRVRIKKTTNDVYKWTLETLEVARKKLPVEDQGFDGRFVCFTTCLTTTRFLQANTAKCWFRTCAIQPENRSIRPVFGQY